MSTFDSLSYLKTSIAKLNIPIPMQFFVEDPKSTFYVWSQDANNNHEWIPPSVYVVKT